MNDRDTDYADTAVGNAISLVISIGVMTVTVIVS